MSVGKTLVSDYKRYIEDYKVKFMILYRRIGLMFTLKEHVIISHVEEYFDTKKETLRWSSEEYLETTHSALRQMEERFRLRTKGRKRGTRVHQERLLRSTYLYNFSRLGFLPHRFDDVNYELFLGRNLIFYLLLFSGIARLFHTITTAINNKH